MAKNARSESLYVFTVDGAQYSVSLIERNYDGFNDILGLTKKSDNNAEDAEQLTLTEAVRRLLLVPIEITYIVKGRKRDGKEVKQNAFVYATGDNLKNARKDTGGLRSKKYNGQTIVKAEGNTGSRKVAAA